MVRHTLQFDDTVTLSKREYLRLKKQAEVFRTMTAKMFELPLKDPVDEVIVDFRATNLYSDGFLVDLEGGLRKSSYVKKYAHQAAQKRR